MALSGWITVMQDLSFSELHSTLYTTETQNQTSMQFYSQEREGVREEGRTETCIQNMFIMLSFTVMRKGAQISR